MRGGWAAAVALVIALREAAGWSPPGACMPCRLCWPRPSAPALVGAGARVHNSGRLLPARPPLPARRRGRGRWGAHACAEQSAEHDARARALVSTDWLQGQLDQEDSGLVLLDVRGQVGKKDVGGGRVETAYEALADDFLAAHIPGAVFVDWTRDIVDLEDDTAPVQLAPLDVFAAAMEEKGVGTDKTVVIYDTGKMLFATRLWWALTIYGHGDVRILNGGWQRWTLEGRDTESDCPTCPLKLYASFDAREAHPALRCNAEHVRELLPKLAAPADPLQDCALQLIDARGKVQYDGSQVRAARGGRIPGAVNVPYKVLIDAAGGYLPVPQLKAKLIECGVSISPSATQTVLYCNGGVASTAVLFAMWLVGVPLSRLSNYDGSWGEWGNQLDNTLFPVVTNGEE